MSARVRHRLGATSVAQMPASPPGGARRPEHDADSKRAGARVLANRPGGAIGLEPHLRRNCRCHAGAGAGAMLVLVPRWCHAGATLVLAPRASATPVPVPRRCCALTRVMNVYVL